MTPLPSFIQAKNCGPDRAGVPVLWVVVHTMEAPEKPGTARAVARWFAGPDAPQASAHYCIDDAECVQCVPETVVAWAAPGANKQGIHLEHAGYAAQTPIQWGDDYSQRVLALSARRCADVCLRYRIPAVRLSAADLRAGKLGICGHRDVTDAFSAGKGHTDPGPNFPWAQYVQMVKDEMSAAALRNTVQT